MDIITHIHNLDLFRDECQALAEGGSKFFSYDGEALTYNVAQIPVVYNNDYTQSVCLVRLVTEDEQETFDALATVDRIGICENKEYIFDDGGEVIYNTVYDQSPVIIDEETTYTPPQMIGVFAWLGTYQQTA
jgi:hypothetical protein